MSPLLAIIKDQTLLGTAFTITHLILLIPIGLLPGIIWLLYFLGEDRKKPEPKRMIIKTFVWGIAIALLAVIVEYTLMEIFSIEPYNSRGFLETIFIYFVIVALTEEYLKYFAVKTIVLKRPEFDEPIDAMIYCIIAALGFASAENLMVIWGVTLRGIPNPLGIMTLRFVGATLLHALAAAIVGYWLGRAYFSRPKKSKFAQTLLVGFGLSQAVIFHGFFNWAMEKGQFLQVALLLGVMIIIVYLGFHRMRKLGQQIIHSPPLA